MADAGLKSAQKKMLHRGNKQPSIDKGAYMINASKELTFHKWGTVLTLSM
jgi:hypothetical protein